VVQGLGCEDYELLATRAAGHCEVCDIDATETVRGALVVDHDHRYGRGGTGQRGNLVAVRGLVCDPCNTKLGHVDAGEEKPSPEIVRYFKHAWFVEVMSYRDGASPLSKVHPDWRTWRCFASAARSIGRDGMGVLREFIQWYCREPGAPAPRRPAVRT
jgi:hypothetical protein